MRSLPLLLAALLTSLAPAQPPPPPQPTSPNATTPADPAPKLDAAAPDLPRLPASKRTERIDAKPAAEVDVSAKALTDAVKRAIEILIAQQEGDDNAEWPYEGVYRVRGQIPVGYRVGGTAIGAMALLDAPGYDTDNARKASVARACGFVCRAINQPLMSFKDYDAGYDVRGWGYTYGLLFLLDLKAHKAIPAGQADAVEKAIAFYLDGIHQTVIPGAGGWNYARPTGRDKSAPPSAFMTAPTLQALFAAKGLGYTVDPKVVDDGLAYLDKARGSENTIVYSGAASNRTGVGDSVPGAIGRMCATEATLMLAGRGKVENVRNAVEKFIEHWSELDKRRVMTGTHERPYMVAPYYFMYAHRYAAQAVEFLPEAERPACRERINRLLFSVRSEDGSWNDRVFARTSGFSTAFALMALLEPTAPRPAGWPAPAVADKPAPNG